MSTIKVFILLLQAVRWFQKRLEKQGLLEEARERAIRELGDEADELIKAAVSARAGVAHAPDSVRDDKNNRDAKEGRVQE